MLRKLRDIRLQKIITRKKMVNIGVCVDDGK